MSVKKLFENIDELLSNRNEYVLISQASVIISTAGVINHILFYVLCTSLGYNDNIYMRIVASASFIPLLFLKDRVHLPLKIILEICFAYSFPFLFSYFGFANEFNTYWKLSLFLAGFLYGILTGRMVNVFILFPFSCLLSFIVYSFLTQSVMVSFFYRNVPFVMVSVLSAFFGFTYKMWILFFINKYIQLKFEHDSLLQKYKMDQANKMKRSLERNLTNSIKMNTLGKLSKDLTQVIKNSMVVTIEQLEFLTRKESDQGKKDQICCTLKLSREATELTDKLWYDEEKLTG